MRFMKLHESKGDTSAKRIWSFDQAPGLYRRSNMSSKKKSKLKKKTIASLISAAIVLLGIAHLWFYLEGISMFLRNTPPWIFYYWPSLQRWLIKQSTTPSAIVFFKSCIIALFWVGLAIVSNRLKVKF